LVDSHKLFTLSPGEKELLSLKLNNANEITDDKDLRMELILNYDFGRTVGIGCLNPYSENFCVLKENGTLQIWNIKNASLVRRFPLKCEVILDFFFTLILIIFYCYLSISAQTWPFIRVWL